MRISNINYGDNVRYIGDKSKFLIINKTYKVKSTLTCQFCGDKLIELYGFCDDTSHCRFCNNLIFKNCFSEHRFEKI